MINLDQNVKGLSETIDSNSEVIRDLNETLANFNAALMKQAGGQPLIKIAAAHKQLFGDGNIEEDLISKALDPTANLQAFEIQFLKDLDGFRGTLQDKANELKDVFKSGFEQVSDDEEEIENRVAMFNDLVDDQVMAVLAKTDEDVQKLAASVSEALGTAFKDLIKDGEFSAKAIGNAFINTAFDIVSEKLIQKPLEDALGDIFGALFGFAGGGSVSPSIPVLVGERGPELFIPHTPGRIANSADTRSMMGGTTINIVQNLNFETTVKNDMFAAIAEAAPIIEERTRQSVFQALRGQRF